MISSILKLLLLVGELVRYLVQQHEREEHEKRIEEIKRNPRDVFANKFGRVRNVPTLNTSDMYDSHPPAVEQLGERNIVE